MTYPAINRGKSSKHSDSALARNAATPVYQKMIGAISSRTMNGYVNQ